MKHSKSWLSDTSLFNLKRGSHSRLSFLFKGQSVMLITSKTKPINLLYLSDYKPIVIILTLDTSFSTMPGLGISFTSIIFIRIIVNIQL